MGGVGDAAAIGAVIGAVAGAAGGAGGAAGGALDGKVLDGGVLDGGVLDGGVLDGGGAAASAWPQRPQKRLVGGFSEPQWAQVGMGSPVRQVRCRASGYPGGGAAKPCSSPASGPAQSAEPWSVTSLIGV
jgi:hypothetical protein